MVKQRSEFDASLKATLEKVGLPGQQRDVVQWLLLRYITEVRIIAALNQIPGKRQQLVDARDAELLTELNDLADTEQPAAVPSTT